MHQCAVTYTLSILVGKWKPLIIWTLSKQPVLRYGQLKREIAGITHKMLSSQLKELEKDGIIYRQEYPQIPPKVEYSLTDKGIAFLEVFESMKIWGNKYKPA
ncbi:helix-turn-helix domain-containing protein [Entomospira entomophila]|uniref:Helix-turn-helix transcriptional regulator n=1 Tax=Entomospira entomophila TaxID=2719988 RepID=A0A968KW03_9SPIO|nr:helix-turn-helix domain-containing protein [Entomospira entomophilus]NIZ40365.1 helix-turn-helix transcriptional regulator [Entomospira entomophilus]WDI35924.1 helix-turn-helix domain-containing protein [Entomospira entomophilus]